MIDFGGDKDYTVARFAPRLRTLHEEFGKPLVLAETNTECDGRVAWLSDLRRMLRGMPWIRAVMWSQLPEPRQGASHRRRRHRRLGRPARPAGRGAAAADHRGRRALTARGMSARRRKPAAGGGAARLIERVLSDPAFRARYRRDPAAAAREAGLEPSDEAAGNPLETLELRESKSSLAGAMLAAAVEGVAVYDIADHVLGGGVADAQAATSQPGRRERPPSSVDADGDDRRHRRRGRRTARATTPAISDDPATPDETDDAGDSRPRTKTTPRTRTSRRGRRRRRGRGRAGRGRAGRGRTRHRRPHRRRGRLGRDDADDGSDSTTARLRRRHRLRRRQRLRRRHRRAGRRRTTATDAAPTSATSDPSTPATMPRASRSRRGWPARRSGAACRRSCP